jgi:hypothetical protein
MQHPYFHVAQVEHLAVGERHEIEVDLALVALVQAVRCADELGELVPARVVIGMNVRVDDVRDLDLGLVRFFDKTLFVTGNDVDRDRVACGRATKEVRKARRRRWGFA